MLKTLTLSIVLPAIYACGGNQAAQAAAQTAAKEAAKVEAAGADTRKEIAGRFDIREAITKGHTHENALMTDQGILVSVNTPYSRVAGAARAARARYRPFTEADVTLEMSAPEAELHAIKLGHTMPLAVVIAPKGSTDANAVVRPIRTWNLSDTREEVHVFPLDALRDGYEIRIVYKDEHEHYARLCPKPGPTEGTVECVVPIDTSKIR